MYFHFGTQGGSLSVLLLWKQIKKNESFDLAMQIASKIPKDSVSSLSNPETSKNEKKTNFLLGNLKLSE